MRRLGVLTNRITAIQFALLLQSRGLDARRNDTAEGVEFWLYDEDRIPELKGELERYERGEYTPVALPQIPAPQPVKPVPRRSHGFFALLWNLIAPAPWTMTICVACVVATSLTGFMELPNRFTRELALIPITPQKGGRVTFLLADDDPVRLIREGQVWRPFTPALLHGGILHLLLDLQVFYVFGTAVEHVRGTLRLIGLTLLSAAAGNLIQYWWGGPVFCGLSGVGYALYGYVWMKTLFQPETRFVIPRSMHIMFWAWTLVCFSGLLPIANGAHSGGLVIGILYGLITFL